MNKTVAITAAGVLAELRVAFGLSRCELFLEGVEVGLKRSFGLSVLFRHENQAFCFQRLPPESARNLSMPPLEVNSHSDMLSC